MQITLASLEETIALGRVMGDLLADSPIPVFFYGDLGMGKTTLIGSLSSSLPGGENAETSSPSFTLCNMYPTSPPVAHFDLYRQENGSVDESLLDFLDGERHLVLVEWAERLPEYALPPTRLRCEMAAGENGRTICFTPYGLDAEHVMEALQTALRSHTVFSPAFSRGNNP